MLRRPSKFFIGDFVLALLSFHVWLVTLRVSFRHFVPSFVSSLKTFKLSYTLELKRSWPFKPLLPFVSSPACTNVHQTRKQRGATGADHFEFRVDLELARLCCESEMNILAGRMYYGLR